MKKLFGILVACVLAVATVIYFSNSGKVEASGDGRALADVKVPNLSASDIAGEIAFNTKCASCHGINASGKDGFGPPLVHKIYEPGHHGDMSFVLAAKQGVRAHHWRFGNMPPVEGITDDEISEIVSYVRTLQRANGIK